MKMRPLAALIAGLVVLLAVGCGSGNTDEKAGDSPAAPPGETLEALWRAPGVDVAVVPGTSDYAPGRNRVSFLIVDEDELVERPTATVYVAAGLKRKPYEKTVARLEPIGVPGGETAPAGSIYVTTITVRGPGKVWFMAEPVGGKRVQALGNLVVGKRSTAPNVGDRAISTETPTLRSTRGNLKLLSTSRKPDRKLYETSVAEAVAAHEPFVVTFATPAFCQTRTCGPVVDVVSAVRRRFVGTDVRFIHAEVYRDNDPAKPVNRWLDDWHLQTEPFTFVVDRNGRVSAKLEGAFSVGELAAAVKHVARR
ncbi:MAG: hypothetical protein U0R50_07185 [Gaiellales bacterium]